MTQPKKGKNPDRDPYDRYFTEAKLAARIVEWAGIVADMRVLEPSAGSGALLLPLRDRGVDITAVELMPEQCAQLRELAKPFLGRFRLVEQQDFMTWRPDRVPFDVGLMNPPFSAGRDGLHVGHALRFCPRVVALVRTNFEHTQRRWNDCMRWAQITRKAVLVGRPPPFGGPGDLNQTPQSDYVVIELVRRKKEREPGEADLVSVEYWT